jgi:amidohydrolase
MVLGAALALHRARAELPPGLAWRAIFQPAEEVSEGALEMIAAGAMEGISTIVALHVDPEFEVGRVGLRTGPMTAECREIHVTVRGRGGHAARPHLAVDPIAAAVQFVSAVYQAVPRSVDARDPVVLTFGSFRGGQQANVIPDRAELLGTIRTFSAAARARVDATLAALARGVGEATGTTLEIETCDETPSVVNDAAVTEVVGRAAAQVVGPENVLPIERPSLGGEDFAWYLAHAPGCLLRLGVAGGLPWPSLHSPLFDIDERALALGAKILARSVMLLS